MKPEQWRLIEDGLCDGRVNMATDHAILQAVEDGMAPPTLRLYGWSAPTLTVGYSQQIGQDVDEARCRELGIPVVRRPTGGRAVLHHLEISYCVVAPVNHPRFPPGLRGTFKVIANALTLCLDELGIPGENDGRGRREAVALWEPGTADSVKSGKHGKVNGASSRSPACFASFNRFEVAVGQKKLIGSAQRRTRRAFLQHGSALLDLDRELLNSLFRFKNIEERKSSLERLRQSAVSLNEAAGRKLSFAETLLAFRQGFCRSFGEAMEAGALTPFEEKLAATRCTTILK
ncbi:MAG: lipoate--protein ligase family protein [Nitrospinae bacterium]|nr:lipoate--protein ligase family protein [Nitrospinota bacterium]